MINKAIRTAGPVEVHVIPARKPPRQRPTIGLRIPSLRQVRFRAATCRRLDPGYRAGRAHDRPYSVSSPARACGGAAVRSARGGLRRPARRVLPAPLATTIAVLLSDYFFIAPLHTLRVSTLSTWSPDHLRGCGGRGRRAVDVLTAKGFVPPTPTPRPQPSQTRHRAMASLATSPTPSVRSALLRPRRCCGARQNRDRLGGGPSSRDPTRHPIRRAIRSRSAPARSRHRRGAAR